MQLTAKKLTSYLQLKITDKITVNTRAYSKKCLQNINVFSFFLKVCSVNGGRSVPSAVYSQF